MHTDNRAKRRQARVKSERVGRVDERVGRDSLEPLGAGRIGGLRQRSYCSVAEKTRFEPLAAPHTLAACIFHATN